MLGYAPESFPEDPGLWPSRLHPEDRPDVFAAVFGPGAKAGYAVDYRFRHCDGHYLWVHDEAKAYRDPGGHPVDVVGC